MPNPRFTLSAADGDVLAARGATTPRDDPERVTPEPENIIVLAHYHPQMAEAFARFPSADWVRVAADANVPLQPVRTPEEALEDEALLAEGAVADVAHPVHGTLRQAGILYTLSETPGRIQRPVPLPGQHDAEIRAEVGRPAVAPPAATGENCGDGPLTGVVVLDLGFAVAGPFGTQLLADLGATVIKVNARRDPWWHAMHIAYSCNRGKRSVGIDLKHPDGLAALHRLVEQADVVHSNMRRDALRRLGVDEASLRAVNPDLIYCHTRGFDKGPRSDSPGNDQTGCSLAGVTHEDGACADGGKPFLEPHVARRHRQRVPVGDRHRPGPAAPPAHRNRPSGRHLDPQRRSAVCVTRLGQARRSPPSPADARPHAARPRCGLPALPRPGTTAGLCLALVTDHHWRTFGEATGLALPADPARAERGTVEAIIEPWFADRTADEAWKALDAAGVPCEIATEHFGYGGGGHPGVHDDPDAIRLGLVVKQHHPKVGSFEHFGPHHRLLRHAGDDLRGRPRSWASTPARSSASSASDPTRSRR